MNDTTPTPRCKVTAFVADRWEHVCPTVRVTAPLRQAGMILLPGNEWIGDDLHFYIERVNDADIILVQRDFPKHREVFEEIVARAREQGKPLVYEIDDLLVELPPDHPDHEFYRLSRAAILWAAAEADMITVSTSALQHYFQSFNPRVHVLPNCLVDDIWKEIAPPFQDDSHSGRSELTVIGFMGGHGHLADLAHIEPAIEHMLQNFPNVRFVSIGCPLPEALRLLPSARWQCPGIVDYAQFVRYFAQQARDVDIFVAPLTPSTFNAHKSGLKYLEYSALGIPGVYSRVGSFPELIRHEVTGFLADSVEHWINYLTLLLQHPELRLQVGRQARSDVEQWLLSHHVHKWNAVYAELLDSPHRHHIFPAPLFPTLVAWYEEGETALKVLREEHKRELHILEGQITSLETLVSLLQEHIVRLNEHISVLNHENRQLQAQLHTIMNSPGWKFLGMIWPLRARLIPPGSRREIAFYRLVQALWTLREQGRGGLLELLRRRNASQPAADVTGLSVSFVPGQKAPTPLFSLVILDPALVEPLQAWLSAQTCSQEVELILWDVNRKEAQNITHGEPKRWIASEFSQLLHNVRGAYIGFASRKLLKRRPTYLEENAIALTSEALGFTLNAPISAALLEASIHGSRIVMDPSDLLVHRSLLVDSTVIAPSAWHQPTVGKMILAEGEEESFGEPLLFQFREAQLQLDWPYLLHVEPPNACQKGPFKRLLHPVETVLQRSATSQENQPTVLLVMPFLAVGGAERVALDMIRYLAKRVHFVVVTTDPREVSLGTMTGEFRRVVPHVYTLPNFLAPELRISFFAYLVQTWRPQTLYVANGSPWIYDELIPAVKARFPNIRTVNQVYDHHMGWINRYDAELIALFDGHIGPNRSICEEYLQRGVPPDRVYLVEHGIDVHEYNPARYTPEQVQELRQQLQLPEDKKIVTFIARFHPQKRPLDFVELARRFVDDPSVLFLMVGDGPLTGTVDAEVQRIGLSNLVHCPFYHPSRDIFAISDVIVLPSEYEGMPLVILEAQAMGKPVVVTDVGNNREVLNITRGGVVISRIGDIGALREGVLNMLEAPPDPDQMRRAIIDHFSWERIAPKYYEALLGAAPSTLRPDIPCHTGASAS